MERKATLSEVCEAVAIDCNECGYPVNRVCCRELEDGITRVIFLLPTLADYGRLLEKPILKDEMIQAWMRQMSLLEYDPGRRPRFSFSFTVDL